jgi:4'-phosphopantetheinyl transferase
MQFPLVNWPLQTDFSSPSRGEVHLYAFRLDAAAQVISDFKRMLSEEERRRAERFGMEHLQRRFIVAHGVMRSVLGGCLSCAPSEVEYAYGVRGKPRLVHAEIEFNLAHSDELGLLAVTRGMAVGVDVEKLRPMPDGLDIARRFFSAREVAMFETVPVAGHDEAFFNLWTRKEAWLKATGDGISESLSKVEFTFRSKEIPEVIAIDGSADAAKKWSLFALSPAPNYVGALAIPAKDVQICCWQAA